ncbi:MAG TPA: AIR synthase-related protein, partial [Micavibrio sp.]
ETWRNITATGALPLAITDNLNFGNPEKPEIMWEFVTCLQGMAEACITLQYPIISGNVSLYNETNGQGILPTPAIGGVGLLDHGNISVGLGFTAEGESIILIGETKGHLGQSLYLREVLGREDGPPPPVDLAAEKRHGDFVRAAIQSGAVKACHDVADGGLLVSIAEMVMASGIGAPLEVAGDAAFWFGEDQARYVVTTATPDKLLEWAEKAGIPARLIGKTGGKVLSIPENQSINITDLIHIHESWLPDFMEGRV